MATKTFGKLEEEVKTSGDYSKEVTKLVGEDFPMTIRVVDGKLVGFEFETSFKVGSTKAVETEEKDYEDNPVLDYEEDYTEKKLTKAQIDKIEKWANENVVSS